MKLTDHTFACNDLTKFEHVVDTMTECRSYVNWQKPVLEKLVKSLKVNLFSEGFNIWTHCVAASAATLKQKRSSVATEEFW